MATQFANLTRPKPPFLNPSWYGQTSNINVAFVAGPAVAAANAALAKLPNDTANSTLDELAHKASFDLLPIKTATIGLISAATTYLSPDICRLFFEWAEASVYLCTTYDTDAEGNARCSAVLRARKALETAATHNEHDLALLAYVQQIEITDASCFGPRGWKSSTEYPTADGLLGMIAGRSPIPDMIDRISTLAFNVCPEHRLSYPPAAGHAILDLLQEGMRDQRSRSSTVPINLPPPVVAVADRATWASAHAAYLAAEDEMNRYDREVHTPAEKVMSDEEFAPIDEHWNGLLDKRSDLLGDLLELPAPSMLDVYTKLSLYSSAEVAYWSDGRELMEVINKDVARLTAPADRTMWNELSSAAKTARVVMTSTPLDSDNDDEVVELCCQAEDKLMVTPAPDIEALADKLVLIRERFPEVFLDACFSAVLEDAHRLAGRAVPAIAA